MKYITGQSCSEVYDIIYKMNLYNKIPKGFIELIKSNRDLQYKVNIDYSKNINEQYLQKGTRILLALIYRDFLCDRQKKEELLRKDKEELIKIERELREKYNSDDIFRKRNQNYKEENTSMIVIQKEKWYQKIFDLIRCFFRKK